MAPSKTPTKPSFHLKVAEADSLEQFQKNAKKAWVAAHPDKHRKPGRPSDRTKIIDAIWSVEVEGKLSANPTEAQLLRAVKKKLGIAGKSQNPKDIQDPERVVLKYARLWLILYKKHPNELKQSDYTFLGNQAPKLHRALKDMIDVLCESGTKKIVKKGTQEGVTPGIDLQILLRNILTILKEQELFLPSENLRANKALQSKISPRLHFQIPDKFLTSK
jgi:hypothetical protein